MSKPLPLTERQVTALAKGAAKAGCVAEVKIGDVVVRLIPKGDAQAERPLDDSPEAALDREFAALEEKLGGHG